MRRVAVPGAIVQSAVATALGALVARALGLELVCGAGLRPGPLRRQHGRPDARPGGQQRPAHAGRPHRRRLARGRGPASRSWRWCCSRRSSAAGDRDAALDGPRADGWSRSTALVAFTAVVGDARDSPAPRLRRRHPLARAVHADRARHRAGDCRRLVAGLQRLDGPRRVPRRDGRRPFRLQLAGGVRGAADARRVRRAVLRLGRHAARSARAPRIARPRAPARWPSCCSASRSSRLAARLGDEVSVQGRVDGGASPLAQIGEFSFILATMGRELGVLHARRDERARGHVDGVDRAQSGRVPGDPACRAVAREETRALGVAEPAAIGVSRSRAFRRRARRGCRSTGRWSSDSARPAAPSCGCSATTASSRRSSS